MKINATSASRSISCSLALRRSVTNQIRPLSRLGRASTGRARNPAAARVVSMQTPTRSMMSQTRSCEGGAGMEDKARCDGLVPGGGRLRIPRGERVRLHLPLDQHALDLGDRFCRIEMLGAGLGAIHDGVAAIEPERIFQIVEPGPGRLVTRIHDEAVRLQ